MRKHLVTILILFTILLILPRPIHADQIDDITTELNKLKQDLAASQNATKPLEADLDKLQKKLDGIKAQISLISAEVIKKEVEVKRGEQALLVQKGLLDQRTFAYYKNIKKAEASFLNLLVANNLSVSLKNFFYQKKIADQDKQTIVRIVLYIKTLEEKKKNLEIEKESLAKIKVEVDKQSAFLAGEVGKAKKYQAELSGKIAQLSAQQQSLVASKLASLNIPRSAATSLGGCVDDRSIDPGFSPRLAFFTYGVPNRTGLNQYGARGRATAGQNYETILRAYYNFDNLADVDANLNINVEGYGGFTLDEYVKRIYEMPESWPLEALKAQAVAARSYALAYTNNGAGSICTTQSCQVFKPEPKGGQWEQAVNDTRGKVMQQGGSTIKAWYSSTHGGYILSTGELPGWSATAWTKHATDTTTGSAGGFGDLNSNAYDKDSPWFYCDWGSRAEYNKTAWLKPDEVADIANVIMLARFSDVDKDHLYQVDKPNPAGKETWSADKVKSELRAKGGSPVGSGADASVGVDFGSGKTSSVNIGGVSFSPSEFKDWFNLRAPANIQIVGPLFNVEKR